MFRPSSVEGTCLLGTDTITNLRYGSKTKVLRTEGLDLKGLVLKMRIFLWSNI